MSRITLFGFAIKFFMQVVLLSHPKCQGKTMESGIDSGLDKLKLDQCMTDQDHNPGSGTVLNKLCLIKSTFHTCMYFIQLTPFPSRFLISYFFVTCSSISDVILSAFHFPPSKIFCSQTT